MIAELLEYHRASYFGVAYADEGTELRNSGVRIPIIVMNPDYHSSEQIIRYNLEPVIFSFPSLERFTGVAANTVWCNIRFILRLIQGCTGWVLCLTKLTCLQKSLPASNQ